MTAQIEDQEARLGTLEAGLKAGRLETDALASALADLDGSIRQRAIALAARYLDATTLCGLVSCEDAPVRNGALSALERQGDLALPAIERVALGDHAGLAMFATQLLARAVDPRCSQVLLRLLDHHDPNVAQAAISGVGALRLRAAVPTLVRLVDADPWLGFAAMEALGLIGDARAVPTLVRRLGCEPIAEQALRVLGQIRSTRALEAVLGILRDEARRQLWPEALTTVGALLEHRPGRTAGTVRCHGASLGSTAALFDFVRAELDGDDPLRARAASAVVFTLPVESLIADAVRLAFQRGDLDWARRVFASVHPMPDRAIARLLRSPEPNVRSAALGLVHTAGRSRVLVRRGLYDSSPEVRVAAYGALARGPDDDVAPLLVSRLVEGTPAERSAVVRALSAMPWRRLQALAPLLSNDGRTEHMLAALDLLNGPAARLFVPRLRLLARHRVAAIRRAATRALTHVRARSVARTIAATLCDEDITVAVIAVDALAGIPGREARHRFRALLASPNRLRYHAILATGRVVAADLADDLQRAFPAAARHERVEIVAALARIGAPSAAPFFKTQLADSDLSVRRSAAAGIAATAAARDLPLLVSLAADSDWVLRHAAALGLARAGPPGREALRTLTRDAESVVATAARKALQGGEDRGAR
jgi:HEAT repeat protein